MIPARSDARHEAASLIGTRLGQGSRVVRGPNGYNRILRTVLRARFSDAQCGFKAVRRGALENLLDDVKDGADGDRRPQGVTRLLADGPIARFIGIGVVSTLAYAVLFLLLRPLELAARTPPRWRSPPPPIAGSPSGSAGASTWCAPPPPMPLRITRSRSRS